MNKNTRYYTRDSVSMALQPHAEDVTGDLDADDGVSFDFDAQSTVRVDDAPWVNAFETDEFFRVDAVVARPIDQTYVVDDERYTFKKPAEELQKATAWVDNVPFTLGHPSSGTVKTIDQIHGFWRNPSYDESADELQAVLYIPAGDSEALNWIETHTDVSVGFYNHLVSADEEGVDAYQTDLYFDHVAGVRRGRCSGEDGCGLNVDSPEFQMTVAEDTVSQPDGTGSSDSASDDTPTSGFGEFSESDSIMCEDKSEDCDCESTTDSETEEVDETVDETESVDSEETDANEADVDDEDTEEVEEDSITVDELAEQYDSVESLVDERDSLSKEVDSLEADKSDLKDNIEALKTELDSVREELDEYKKQEKQEIVQQVVDASDGYWEEEELMELDESQLEDKLELAKHLGGSTKTANPTGDSGESTSSSNRRRKLDLSQQ